MKKRFIVCLVVTLLFLTVGLWGCDLFGGGSSGDVENPSGETSRSASGLVFKEITDSSGSPAYSVIGYDGSGKDVVIPSLNNGKPVISISDDAFSNCDSIISVTIPNSVTSIGDDAFEYCYKLVEVINLSSLNITKGSFSNGYVGYYALNVKTSGSSDIVNKDGYLFYTYNNTNYLLGYVGNDTELTLPDKYKGQSYEIYEYAFYNCSSLQSVTIGNSVTSIGDRAFEDCSSLTNITIGNSVTSIGDCAFEDCSSLTSITIPNSVTSIGEWAFRCCYKLIEVINLSSLKISPTSYGLSALKIKTSGTSDIVNKDGYLFYTYNNTNYLLGYVGNDTELTLPDNYNGQSYKINGYAFYKNDKITSIIIPNSVTSIGDWAFRGCSSLTSITIPNSVTSIGWDAFSGCSSLTSITIPNSVKSIGSSAFSGCSKLENIYYIGDINSWVQIEGLSYLMECGISNKKLYINGVLVTNVNITTATEINMSAFYNCTSITSITIGNGVTSIGGWAFSGCSSLTSVTIGSGVASIGYSAFEDCSSLTSITIPNSVTSIGDRAFEDCSSLQSVTIGNSVTSIGSSAFKYCYKLVEVINLSTLNIRKGWSSDGYIGCYALNVKTSGTSDIVNKGGYLFYTYDNTNYLLGYVGNDTELTLPDNYNGQSYEIYKYAFYENDKLTSVTIGNSVTSIGDYAFYNCSSLTSITIPNSVTSIGSGAFSDCSSLTSVTIGSGVASIGYSAFEDCSSLTSVTIGNSVTSIGSNAFYFCSSLTSVTIGNSVTSIGSNAFRGCYKLVEVINLSSLSITTMSYGLSALNIKTSGTSDVVRYGDYLFYTYGNVNYLLGYVGNDTKLTLPDNYNGQSYKIYKYAFYDNDKITSVTIGNSVTSIGDFAFYYCSSLTSVTIPNSVTSIGSSAFRNCSSLTSVTIGNSVTSIEDYAFSNCSSLTSVTIPNSVTSIGSYAFYYCSSLTSITIPNSVTSIGDYAFRGCSKLTSIVFEDTTYWYITKNSDFTGGSQISVTNSTTNATNFKSKYKDYYWYKK